MSYRRQFMKKRSEVRDDTTTERVKFTEKAEEVGKGNIV